MFALERNVAIEASVRNHREVTVQGTVATPSEVARRLIREVCALVTGDSPGPDALIRLYATETDVQHPLAPLGDRPLRSPEELRRHFGQALGRAGILRGFRAEDLVVHQTQDPEVCIADFRYVGEGPVGKLSAPCLFVLRVRDGVIVESRDYIDHLAFARALGDLPQLAAALVAGP